MSQVGSLADGTAFRRPWRLALRHWPTWAGLMFLRLAELCPYSVLCALGVVLGQIAYCLPLKYVRIARRNIELCFPDLSPTCRKALLRKHMHSLGMGLIETGLTFWSSNERLARLAKIEGLEHLEAALARGRGAIMVGGHFTTIEIATRILGTRVPLHAVYRPTKNEVIADMFAHHYARHGGAIRHDDIRAMARALRQNGVVWYAPDQSFQKKGAAMVPFFGIDAATTTYTSRLAKMTGASVLTYFPQRLPGRLGYCVSISRLPDVPSESAISDSLRFNKLLEEHIRKVPEQYLWIHRRFKGLSDSYPNYYGRDGRQRRPAEKSAD